MTAQAISVAPATITAIALIGGVCDSNSFRGCLKSPVIGSKYFEIPLNPRHLLHLGRPLGASLSMKGEDRSGSP
jgi:hypothetical protein